MWSRKKSSILRLEEEEEKVKSLSVSLWRKGVQERQSRESFGSCMQLVGDDDDALQRSSANLLLLSLL